MCEARPARGTCEEGGRGGPKGRGEKEEEREEGEGRGLS